MDACPRIHPKAFDGPKRPVSSPPHLKKQTCHRYTARMARRDFKALFCEHFGCPPSEFENRAFRELLYWHAKALAPVVRKLKPEFFTEDFRFIQYLGETSRLREAKANAADFKEANAARRSFWRTGLRIRVSGMKATKLAHRLFAHGGRRHVVHRGRPNCSQP